MSNVKDLASKILADFMLDAKSEAAKANARRVLDREQAAGKYDDDASAAGWKAGLTAGLTVAAIVAIVAVYGFNRWGLFLGGLVGFSGAAMVWMWRGQHANARLQALWIRLKPEATESSSD